jgi:uncharacterized membrane protein YqiK
MSTFLLGVIIPAGLILAALLVVGLAFARMYKRATREVSLVKTGSGGRKVIIDGGTLVIPVLHEVTKINMRTTRLDVKRAGMNALITKDHIRVDAGVEFYVSVAADDEGIARAAQTLGDRTFDETALRDMVEGKLDGGLRAVAAKMDLFELHQNRSDFVQQVQQAVSEDLTKNGLMLESVSLTALDQTPTESLDEDNIFNAEGMKLQAERIAESKKRRAQISAEAEVSVAKSLQQAEVEKYEVQREQETARVEQRVKMIELAAREASEKARKDEDAMRAAEEARIERMKAIEISEQERQITVAKKSEEESQARAAADLAKAEAIKATESIETARQIAEGERKKRLSILSAEEEAEKDATTIRVAASAERQAAEDRAAAMHELARAEADQIIIRASAVKEEKLAEAEGTRALIDAENSLSDKIIDFRLAKARLDSLPSIVAEMVKPAEKIGGITIHKVDGLNGFGSGSGASDDAAHSNGGGGLVNQAFDEIRRNAFTLPALNAIGKSVGVNMESGMSGILDSEFSPEQMTQALAGTPSDIATENGADAEAPSDESAQGAGKTAKE